MTAEGGGDRNVAEAQVAAAHAAEGRGTIDPSTTNRANDEQSVHDPSGVSPNVAPTADERHKDPASTPETPLTDTLEQSAQNNEEPETANG